MKILVTGASGFIGSNLVEKLLNEDNEVIGMDIAFDRQYLLDAVIPKDEKMYNKQFNRISKNFSMIWDDINDISKYYYVMDDVDKVYHLAASADIRASYQDPTLDLKNNVQGTNAILEMMRKKDIKNLIFSSSSSVYGIAKVIPTPEDVSNLRPISMYGASKLANEAFISAYSDLYGMKAWLFRFANVVGQHQHRGVIFDFIQKLKDNSKELEILGNGKQKKSYFHVNDCVDALIHIPDNDSNKDMKIYNLATYDLKIVDELADIVCNEMKLKPKYYHTGGDRGWKGDAPYTILDISKALNSSWKPTMNCEEAIRATTKYMLEKSL